MSKRLLCLFLSVLMLLPCSVPAFGATFNDVPETNQYYEAIDMLSEFGIILGDAGTGAFRPEAEISREEFSVIVTRILGLTGFVPSMDNLPFTDVTPVVCDEWAIIATKLAYDLGIISGYGNGKFGPKDPVTYEQVVKMLVCTIGYGPAAEELGGWPNGYIKVANNLGITEDAVMLQTGNAPRGIVAQLVYNCLYVDLMEAVGGGQSEIKYGHTLLTDKLGYYVDEGVITGIPGLTYIDRGKVVKDGEVEIDSEVIYNAGNTNAAEYFGYRGEFYYQKKGTKSTLISFKPDEDNIVYEFEPERIVDINENSITYYIDEDESDTETLSIKGATYIYNGKAKDISAISKPNIGTMKLIDNDDDEVADLVILNDTRVMVVNSVDSIKKIVTNKFDTSERLVLDGASKEVVVLKDGKSATFSAIVRDSVLMVSENDERITVDVITKSVAGAVESEEENGEIIGIGGKKYEFMPAYLEYLKNNPDERLTIGDDVTIYITSDNRILFGKVKTVTTKIGYLINAVADEDDELTQARILNSSGKIQVVKFAEKTKINGVNKEYDEIVGALVSALADEETGELLTNRDENAENATMSQLIKYVENGGVVTAVYTMQKSGDKTRNLILDVPYTEEKHAYSTTTKKIGETGVTLDAKTKIFRVPSVRNSFDDYGVRTGTSGLANTQKYQFEAYDMSDTGVAGVIVVYGAKTTAAWSGIATISAISTKVNKEDQKVNSVTLITNGKASTKETEDLKVLEGFSVGDVIHYATKDGAISDAKKLYSPAMKLHGIYEAVEESSNYEYTDYYYGYGSKKTGIDVRSTNMIVGTVHSRDDDRMVVVEGGVDEDGVLSDDAKRYTFDFNDTIVYYLYDASKDKPFILSDAEKGIEITKEFLSTYLDAGEAASKVVIYSTSYTTVKFIYIIEN